MRPHAKAPSNNTTPRDPSTTVRQVNTDNFIDDQKAVPKFSWESQATPLDAADPNHPERRSSTKSKSKPNAHEETDTDEEKEAKEDAQGQIASAILAAEVSQG